MPRLNIERQHRLEPKRIETAIRELSKLGIAVHYQDATSIRFMYAGAEITYWPYSGWASGKTIKDGRGLKNLLKQINPI